MPEEEHAICTTRVARPGRAYYHPSQNGKLDLEVVPSSTIAPDIRLNMRRYSDVITTAFGSLSKGLLHFRVPLRQATDAHTLEIELIG